MSIEEWEMIEYVLLLCWPVVDSLMLRIDNVGLLI